MISRKLLSLAAGSLALAFALVLALPLDGAAPPAKADPSLTAVQPAPIKESAWKTAPKKPITPAEIDEMLTGALRQAGITPDPIIGDEQFLRRVYLDLWGKPPTVAEVRAFAADRDEKKRAKLIDKLLEGDAFARNWARYWHDVMAARIVGNFQSRALARPFERWLGDQLKANRSWAEITREVLTASGEAKFDDTEGKAGKAYFLGSHMGADAIPEQAAETARVFLGIQINCAQCHNHPFDVWKQEQFHQLAAYFARLRPRLMRDPESTQVRFIGVNLAATDNGFGGKGFGGGFGKGKGGNEYRMPGKDNVANAGPVVHPRSLDGKTPSRGLKDVDRRKSLVDSMVSKENYWFAGAFVNRTWGVLLGQAFYPAVDDLGPMREAVHGPVLTRLSGSFAGSDYDIKGLFRVIMNTEAYQRESRTGVSRGEHLLFAASYPTRLRPTALWDSLINTVGPIGGPAGGGKGGRMMFGGPFGGGGLEGAIRTEFSFDPSLKNDDIEGSIPQMLALMNNPQLNQRIRASGSGTLAKILDTHKDNAEAVEAVYLQALTRKPTSRELSKCLAHVKQTGSRSEAFEDILWALINSTEFQTRR